MQEFELYYEVIGHSDEKERDCTLFRYALSTCRLRVEQTDTNRFDFSGYEKN